MGRLLPLAASALAVAIAAPVAAQDAQLGGPLAQGGPGGALAGGVDADKNPPAIYDGRIVAADLWDDELRILSAGMGFDGITGWPDTEIETIEARQPKDDQPA